MTSDQGLELLHEIKGVLLLSVTNVCQHDAGGSAPMWLITGVADYTRIAAGFVDPSQRAAGGGYADGYQTTAFFFDWLNQQHPDFVYQMNRALAPNALPP